MRQVVASAAFVGVFVLGSMSHAQSQFTKSQMNALTTGSNPQTFSSNRIRSNVINRAVPQYQFSNVNRGILSGATGGGAPAQRSKPFANANQGPSTSPYMGLLSQTPFTSSTSNYFNIVKPQLEQQRANERLQAQNMRLQQQLGEAAAKGPYSTTGSEERAPTGHTAVYMNNGGVYGNPGGYYPQVEIRSVRGQKQ